MQIPQMRHVSGDRRWVVIGGLGCLLMLASCGERVHVPPAEVPADVVVQIGDRSITTAQWEAALERLGPGASPRQQEQLLGDLVRAELLAGQAQKAGYQERPDLRAHFDRLVGAAFKEEKLAPLLAAASMATDAEIAAYYQAHASNYVTPDALRLGVIWIKVSPKADAERQAQAEARAETLLAEARQADLTGFAALTRQHSEDEATRYRGGDTGWISRDSAGGHWPAIVLDAGEAMISPGDCARVRSDNGIYVVRLLEKRPAAHRPLAQVRDGVGYLVVREKQQQAERAFYEQLSAGVPIRFNHSLLDSISNSVSSAPPPLPGG